jgi:hypothetical protein
MSAARELDAALAAEREAYTAQLAGLPARQLYGRARDAYLASHAQSGPASWGRLIGALKMALLAGDGARPVAVQAMADTAAAQGPAAAYARALAAVTLEQPPDVVSMLEAGGAFQRTGLALRALAAGDGDGYRRALEQIVADFAARDQHLSGVAVADTAMVLEQLAEVRGMAVSPESPLVPQMR